jgi:hypothetical protein
MRPGWSRHLIQLTLDDLVASPVVGEGKRSA